MTPHALLHPRRFRRSGSSRNDITRITRIATAFLVAWSAGGLPVAAAPDGRVLGMNGGYPAESVHSLALHMHGSMSEQFASWEWHAWKAESLGVDVVWWTDHDWRLTNWRHTNKYDFESSFWFADSTRWREPDDQYAGAYRQWQADPANTFLFSAVVDTLAVQGTHSLRLGTNATLVGPEFDTGRLEHTATAVQDKYSLGVYYVRLEHDGDTVLRKVARVR